MDSFTKAADALHNLDMALNCRVFNFTDAAMKRTAAELYKSMLEDLMLSPHDSDVAIKVKELVPFKLDQNMFLVHPEISAEREAIALLKSLVNSHNH